MNKSQTDAISNVEVIRSFSQIRYGVAFIIFLRVFHRIKFCNQKDRFQHQYSGSRGFPIQALLVNYAGSRSEGGQE